LWFNLPDAWLLSWVVFVLGVICPRGSCWAGFVRVAVVLESLIALSDIELI